MEIMHIEAKSRVDLLPVLKKAVAKLPRKIGLVTTIQHLEKLQEAKEFLEKNEISAKIAGQVLGCNAKAAEKIKDSVDAFVYIGSGRFHPLQIAIETGKRVITINPFSGAIDEVSQEEIKSIEKRRKGALLKFLSAENIGILASTKPGQNKLKDAIKLKESLEKKGKKAYIFIADNIDLNQCENFSFIESWVNSACPRIEEDKPGILDIAAALKSLK